MPALVPKCLPVLEEGVRDLQGVVWLLRKIVCIYLLFAFWFYWLICFILALVLLLDARDDHFLWNERSLMNLSTLPRYNREPERGTLALVGWCASTYGGKDGQTHLSCGLNWVAVLKDIWGEVLHLVHLVVAAYDIWFLFFSLVYELCLWVMCFMNYVLWSSIIAMNRIVLKEHPIKANEIL